MEPEALSRHAWSCSAGLTDHEDDYIIASGARYETEERTGDLVWRIVVWQLSRWICHAR